MTYETTPTFWLDSINESARGMRRYGRDPGSSGWTCVGGFHDAITWIDRVATVIKTDLDGTRIRSEVPSLPLDDERWPQACKCGRPFSEADPKQTFSVEIYRHHETGQEFTIHPNAGLPGVPPAPGGAMWNGYWLPSAWRADDGIGLVVMLPNGNIWHVDSQASNCTRPDEPHKCWVREGDPRTGRLTVGKNGDTCEAGAGSIQSGDYHGLLIEGVLIEC